VQHSRPERPEFELDVIRRGEDGAAIFVKGELDIANAAELDAAIAEATEDLGGGSLLIDFHACSFIDSTGLRAVIKAAQRLEERGRELGICRASGPVLRAFELTALEDSPGLYFRHEAPFS
jgi:anti-sigma B factor antagonist